LLYQRYEAEREINNRNIRSSEISATERDLDVLLVSFEVHIGGAFGFRSAINSANGRHR
jgi:hypothetical protein